MQKHRVYYGFLENPHYFVEVRRGFFDEWNAGDIRDITHRRIVKWNLRERGSDSKTRLMMEPYLKHGCKDTLRLLGTVERKVGYIGAKV